MHHPDLSSRKDLLPSSKKYIRWTPPLEIASTKEPLCPMLHPFQKGVLELSTRLTKVFSGLYHTLAFFFYFPFFPQVLIPIIMHWNLSQHLLLDNPPAIRWLRWGFRTWLFIAWLQWRLYQWCKWSIDRPQYKVTVSCKNIHQHDFWLLWAQANSSPNCTCDARYRIFFL